MVHFTWCGSAALFYSRSRFIHRCMRVTPFGHPRVTGYVLLSVAFRSLSRPSSPYGSIGIRHRPIFRLTILSFPPHSATPAPGNPSVKLVPSARSFVRLPQRLQTFRPSPLLFPSLHFSKNSILSHFTVSESYGD